MGFSLLWNTALTGFSMMKALVVNPFQPSATFHIEAKYLKCKSNDWFLYEMQHWAEMGYWIDKEIKITTKLR